MMDLLPAKVKFVNLRLNKVLEHSGKVTEEDLRSVITQNMRDTRRLIVIEDEELLKLTKDSGFVEFVKIKEVA